jgi:hypothetical protein
MKDKIESIFNAPTSYEHKVELIGFLIEKTVKDVVDKKDEYLMELCNAFLIFSANRNDMIVTKEGLIGFANDCVNTSKEAIWEEFKDYLKAKSKILMP